MKPTLTLLAALLLAPLPTLHAANKPKPNTNIRRLCDHQLFSSHIPFGG